ncbi:unnamed protein product [Enterobius vermicularis]|uniref:GYF domain-containing protein n=1 Tax=Enterobius vermicularis TaxID=51028 RepID=A0A0N4V428_ENTVE|nr:unnamed protein product [Enterobius vermicularis]
MRSTSTTNNAPVPPGKPSMNRVDAPALNVVQDYPLSEPIFVKNRYGREDLLALLPRDSTYPDGLQKCQFFVEIPQQPIVLTPLTDAETVLGRLQHNINSSKAMSALSHAERTLISSSNVIGQGNTAAVGSTGPSSQSSWAGGSNVGRGGGQSARGSFNAFRGRGGQVLSAGAHAGNVPETTGGSKYVPVRGRGSGTIGRGGSTSTFNSRAQGLYDPRDPRDRPRQRVRSVSDDTTSPLTSSGSGGAGQTVDDTSACGNAWSQPSNRSSWRKYAANSSGLHQHGSTDSSSVNRTSMPEWMVDEQEKGPDLVSTRSGSFDENGQFRASDSSPKSSAASNAGSILTKIAGTKDTKQPETRMRAQVSPRAPEPIPISNPWNVISEAPENRLDISEQLAQQTQMSLLLPSAPIARLTSDIFEPKIPEEVQVTSRPLVTNVNPAVTDDEWYYVDPRNSLQGPFPTSHMEAWFKSGYFSRDLNVRKGSGPNAHFQTLGELIQVNGGASPFRSKPVDPASIVPVHLSLQSQNPDLSGNPWTGEINESLLKAAKVEEQRQKLEEEQRRVAEKEKELKEMQENLKRQEEERLMKVREMELKLQQQQEELARRAAEERERAAAREREMEVERRRIAEEIERAKREEIRKALADERKREEEERIAREKEIARIKAEAESLRLEKLEKEEAARKAEEEARKRALALEEQKRKELLEKERELAKQTSIEAKKQLPAKIEVTEEFAPASKQRSNTPHVQQGGTKVWQAVYRTGDEKLITTKVAPWQASGEGSFTAGGKKEKSLLEIQQEEERQLLAERKQKQEGPNSGRSGATGSVTSGGVWAASPQKLSWSQHTQLNRQASSPTTKTVAWGGAGLHQETRPVSLMFDGPSLESSNKQSKKNLSSPAKSNKTSSKDAWQVGLKQDTSKLQQETVKKLFKQTATDISDGFTKWVVQRVKQLNSQVDADVLAEFIENVDSPDEVEDYIIGYLGDNTQVKEFVREFLAKRGDARLKKRAPIKDDLSGPAPAADPSSSGNSYGGNGNGQQHSSTGGKKKKKGKGGRLIVDGACLGFKGTADSNRVNIGEIATLSAMEVGHR